MQRHQTQRGRSAARAPSANDGRLTGTRPRQPGEAAQPLDISRTLNAAVLRQTQALDPAMAMNLIEEDLYLQVRRRQPGRLIVFVVDTSDSMGDGPAARMTAALGAILAISAQAYLNRDKVCLITFRDRQAQLVVPPTSSITRIRQQLSRLPVGGATPLSAGLLKARQVIRQARIKNRGGEPLLVLISDGETTIPMYNGGDPVGEAMAMAAAMHQERIQALVINTSSGGRRTDLMPRLAEAFGTRCQHLHALQAGQVLQLIRKTGESTA